MLTIHFCRSSLSIENHQLKDRRGKSCFAGGFQEYLIKIYLLDWKRKWNIKLHNSTYFISPQSFPGSALLFSSASSCTSAQVKLQVKIEASFCWCQSYWLIFFDDPKLFLISSMKDVTLYLINISIRSDLRHSAS